MQTTHTEVQDGHERPALSLREITCIVILFFGGGTLLTQISSTYKIIVSALTVPVTSSTHLLSECQYCRYRKLNAGCFTNAMLLTPIVHHSSRGRNCKTKTNVRSRCRLNSAPRTCEIAGYATRIDKGPPAGIIWDYCHIVWGWMRGSGKRGRHMTMAFMLNTRHPALVVNQN